MKYSYPVLPQRLLGSFRPCPNDHSDIQQLSAYNKHQLPLQPRVTRCGNGIKKAARPNRPNTPSDSKTMNSRPATKKNFNHVNSSHQLLTLNPHDCTISAVTHSGLTGSEIQRFSSALAKLKLSCLLPVYGITRCEPPWQQGQQSYTKEGPTSLIEPQQMLQKSSVWSNFQTQPPSATICTSDFRH